VQAYNPMVDDLTRQIQPVLAIGEKSARAIDCEVGSTVTLLFGVYRVDLIDGRKQFVKERDLTDTEKSAIGKSLKVSKPAPVGGLHW